MRRFVVTKEAYWVFIGRIMLNFITTCNFFLTFVSHFLNDNAIDIMLDMLPSPE